MSTQSSIFARLALTFCLVLLLTPWVANAGLCNLDDVPAATLLLPYFEVDLEDPARMTTLFSVINAAPDSTLAKITLWSDLAVPTLTFNIYLTGYDVVTVNMADIFQGIVPQTGPGLFPAGDFSRPHQIFPGCEDHFPLGNIPPILVDHIRTSHTGHASTILGGQCAGVDHDDLIARGYVTIDVVRTCSLIFPDHPDYFGPDGVAGYDNVLWGDYFFVNSSENFAQGDNLVRIEADPEAFGEGDYTFYARYVGADGSDGREPLATTWGARYLNGGAFTGGTSFIGWRDSKVAIQPFDCGDLPVEALMPEAQVVIFDEDENPNELEWCFWGSCPPGAELSIFQFAATRVGVGGPDFPVPFDFGWVYLNLNAVEAGFQDPYAQGWIGTLHDASGRFSVGYGATSFNSACEPSSLVLPEEGNVGGIPPGNAP